MITDILLALHLIGLMMGAGGGFGGMITMREAAKRPPDQIATLTLAAITVEITYAQVKAGNAAQPRACRCLVRLQAGHHCSR